MQQYAISAKFGLDPHDVTDQCVLQTLGELYNEILLEAEASSNIEERDHGRWMRAAISNKLATHHVRYH